MLKYLLAALTFIVGLFLIMLISVLMQRSTGFGIGHGIMAVIVLGATRFVFKRLKEKENVKNYGAADYDGLLKDDIKNLKKFFGEIVLQYGITDVIAMGGKDGVSDFVIGIRTKENYKINYDDLKAGLHKIYFKQIKFVFINLNVMESEELKRRGTKIV